MVNDLPALLNGLSTVVPSIFHLPTNAPSFEISGPGFGKLFCCCAEAPPAAIEKNSNKSKATKRKWRRNRNGRGSKQVLKPVYKHSVSRKFINIDRLLSI